MGKLNLDGLRKLRIDLKKEIEKKKQEGKEIKILIGMGTCGIAAGARETFQTFSEQVEKMGLKNVVIEPTGCMGACYVEPTVEVHVPEMPDILYGKVTPDVAKKILERHIIQKQLINDFIYDKPAVDICE
jgi:NADP-reducing hydrogenase subunit HndB